jgi:hypothetical protein
MNHFSNVESLTSLVAEVGRGLSIARRICRMPAVFAGCPPYLLDTRRICWIPAVFAGCPPYLLDTRRICWIPAVFAG